MNPAEEIFREVEKETELHYMVSLYMKKLVI
jgi:hypothetical protein